MSEYNLYLSKEDSPLKLREAEKVEIISLVDNYIDLLSSSEREEVKSFREWVEEKSKYPIAEHGFSMLIRVYDGGESHTMLFDAGGSTNGIMLNARRMGLSLAEVECIVLSHGHYDHFMGLPAAVKAIGKSGLPIIVHGDMFRRRGVARNDGTVRVHPKFPSEEKVKPAVYIEARKPCLIADGLVLITGEIPRKTVFETGFPQNRILINGRWEPDPYIWDDRALIINVKRKGLVVLSGCGHAGIINTILYAQHLTGVENVYAVIGGFHLSGKDFEVRIDQTVKELKRINPKLVAPSHCTGWRANCMIFKAMPDSFVWSRVGNLYIL
jgi:7,8-dihydropterin-6-yl-methyl-4-(beta-D-ribofuranosyl)aminobenzene 5'-phosphate synthase